MRGQVCRIAVAMVTASMVSAVWVATASAAADGPPTVRHVLVWMPVGSIFSKIVGAILGAFSWTVGVAGKFILVTVASLVRMLIPRSWAHVPVEVFEWIVAVPNFAGTITSPSGQTQYGFAGVNDMRELLEWIGIALLPLTLTWAGGRALIGAGDQLAAPVVRLLGLAGVLAFYPFLWGQGAALVDQVTHLILSPAPVTDGIRQLMAYAVEGVALGGWQLIDLALMGAIALELLALIFVKVVVVLVGAIVYATGPLLIGVVPTETGGRIVRAWGGAAIALLALPVAWAVIFALGAVLIGDTNTAGPLVGGSTTVQQLLGSVIVAIAGVATLWLCLRASREAATVFRGQIGMIGPAVSSIRPTRRASAATAGSVRQAQRQPVRSLRGFQQQVGAAAGTRLASMGPAGRHAAKVAAGAASVGRRGLVASGASITGRGARAAVTAARSRRPADDPKRRSGSGGGAAKPTPAGRADAATPSPVRTARWRRRRTAVDRQPTTGQAASRAVSPQDRTQQPGAAASRPAAGNAPFGTSAAAPGRSVTHGETDRQPKFPAARTTPTSRPSPEGTVQSPTETGSRSPNRRVRRSPKMTTAPKPKSASDRPAARSSRPDPEDGERWG